MHHFAAQREWRLVIQREKSELQDSGRVGNPMGFVKFQGLGHNSSSCASGSMDAPTILFSIN